MQSSLRLQKLAAASLFAMYVTLVLTYLKQKVSKFKSTIFKNSNQVKELVSLSSLPTDF